MRLAMIAAIAGLAVASRVSALPSLSTFLPTVLLFTLLWMLIWRKAVSLPAKPVVKHVRTALLMLLSFVFGAVWSLLYCHLLLARQIPAEYSGEDFIVRGVVSSLVDTSAQGQRFDFYVTGIHSRDKSRLLKWQPKKIRLAWYGAQHSQAQLSPGQQWQFQVRMKALRGLMNPAGFDYQGWMVQQGYSASAYVRKTSQNQRIENASLPILLQGKVFFEAKRFILLQKITRQVEEGFARAVFAALAIGYKGLLTSEHWQVLKRSGTVHLLVVSGLHIGLFALLGYLLGSLLSRLLFIPLTVLPAVVWSSWSSMFFALGYAGLSGFSLPAQRALVMLCCGLLATLLRRYFPVSSLYLMALLAVLLFDPLAVFSPGLYLSFAAVGVLLYGFSARTVQARLEFSLLQSGWSAIKKLLYTQYLVFVGLLPLLLYWVGENALSMPLVNFFAVPLVSFILLPLVLVTALLMMSWPSLSDSLLQDCLLSGYSFLVKYFWEFLHWSAQHTSLVNFQQGGMPIWMMIIISMFGALIILSPKGLLPRFSGVVLLGTLCFPLKHTRPYGEFQLTALDVGQGLSVVVETQSQVLVYDTGNAFSERFNIGRNVLAPFLKRQGYGHVDTLVISHGDRDHIGGLEGLMEELPVQSLMGSIAMEDRQTLDGLHGLDFEHCEAGQGWHIEGVRFEFLSPHALSTVGVKGPVSEGKRKSKNNQSCVLRVSNDRLSVLLTGDIEKEQERWLSLQQVSLSADVLLVPHHGSNTSSSRGFLQAVNPDLAIVSNGFANPYGHPHPKVLARYEQAGIPILRTDLSGAIVFNSHEGLQKLWQARRDGTLRFWHNRQAGD